MLQSLLQTFALTVPGEEFSDRTSLAGIVSLQGMLTIFLVLIIIWAAIEIMHRILNRGSDPKPAKKQTSDATQSTSVATPSKSPTPNADDAAIAAAIAAAMAAAEDEGALIAAITAAVSAALAEDGYTGGFRVVSFKRVGAQNRRRF